MTNKYYPNNLIRFSMQIVASGNLTVNPSFVRAATFFESVESIDTGSVVNPSCGFFYFDYEVQTPGIYGVRWITDSSHLSQSFGAIQVNSIPFS